MALRIFHNEIEKAKDRVVFFDTNVLVNIFWPIYPEIYWAKINSKIFNQLLIQKNRLITDFITLSELINLEFNLEYEKNKTLNNTLRKKDFRNSQQGQEILSDIFSKIKDEIFIWFDIHSYSFSKTEIEDFITNKKLDFNDSAIVKICKDNDYILLTNDLDFKDTDIDILTANQKLQIGRAHV